MNDLGMVFWATPSTPGRDRRCRELRRQPLSFLPARGRWPSGRAPRGRGWFLGVRVAPPDPSPGKTTAGRRRPPVVPPPLGTQAPEVWWPVGSDLEDPLAGRIGRPG